MTVKDHTGRLFKPVTLKGVLKQAVSVQIEHPVLRTVSHRQPPFLIQRQCTGEKPLLIFTIKALTAMPAKAHDLPVARIGHIEPPLRVKEQIKGRI